MSQRQRKGRIPTSFEQVTVATQRLLDGEEGIDVEFKRSLNGLEADDLVAFANSPHGGTIFIGVEEVRHGHIRRGQIVGCDVGDRPKQAILGRAVSCQPAIKVTVYQEGLATPTPFFRIDIPPGVNKPYATSSGTYKIRGDGRNQALTPDALLALFLATQTNVFVDRFRAATRELQQELQDEFSAITAKMHEFNDLSERTLEQIDGGLQDVFSVAEDAGSRADDASKTIDQVFGEVNGIGGDTAKLHMKVDALLEHYSIPDPVIEKAGSMVVAKIMSGIFEKQNKDEIKKWFFIEYPTCNAGAVCAALEGGSPTDPEQASSSTKVARRQAQMIADSRTSAPQRIAPRKSRRVLSILGADLTRPCGVTREVSPESHV